MREREFAHLAISYVTFKQMTRTNQIVGAERKREQSTLYSLGGRL